jgi:hypothetical protein
MVEIRLDEFGMNFHPKLFEPLMDELYACLICWFWIDFQTTTNHGGYHLK